VWGRQGVEQRFFLKKKKKPPIHLPRARALTAGAVDDLREVGDNLDIDGLDDLGGEEKVRLGLVVLLGRGGNVQGEDGSVQHILPKQEEAGNSGSVSFLKRVGCPGARC
jgi:hypothetical protein